METANLSDIRELSKIKADTDHIISFYLNVDGAERPRKQDLETDLKSLLRKVEKDWLQDRRLDHRQKSALSSDLRRIDHFVRHEFHRGETKGLAIFVSASAGLWKVYALPVPVSSTVFVAHEPITKNLTAVLARYPRFCTVIVDRRKARIFSVRLQRIEELFGVFEDNVPDKVDVGEWSGWRQSKIANHIEDHVQRHLKNIAAITSSFFKSRGFDRLIIGCSREVMPYFKEALSPYLRERVIGQFFAETNMPLQTVLKQSIICEGEAERILEEELLAKIGEAGSPGGAGVAGLEHTIEALVLGRVHQLVLASDLEAEGWACDEGHFLALRSGECPVCGGLLTKRDDLVEDMIQMALEQNSSITYINHLPDFIEKERAAAILRYAS